MLGIETEKESQRDSGRHGMCHIFMMNASEQNFVTTTGRQETEEEAFEREERRKHKEDFGRERHGDRPHNGKQEDK